MKRAVINRATGPVSLWKCRLENSFELRDYTGQGRPDKKFALRYTSYQVKRASYKADPSTYKANLTTYPIMAFSSATCPTFFRLNDKHG